MTPSEPLVSLVGAGPGDPGLLTLRAVELLAQADLVVHDQLVPKRMLDYANPHAEIICVRDLPGVHPDKAPHIFDLLIDTAKRGKKVVRLKGGDPLVFGRGGEEADALRAAGVAYEIIPGVTAALAAAACLDLPLTHRKYSSAVALITGHELPAKPGGSLDWQALAAFPGTLAIYMGIARLPLIVAELLRFGKSPDTPAAIVERASTGEMRTITATLETLDAARRQAGLEAPGLILVGEAVARRIDPSWYEARPLFGVRVLVTRPRHQAESLMRGLERCGAVPVLLPALTVKPPQDLSAFDDVLARLHEYDWVVYTSTNGVQAVANRLLELKKDARVYGLAKVAAIGTKTAESLKTIHLYPDLVPTSFSSEGMLAALLPHVKGKRVLVVRANRGRDLLPTQLATVANVDTVVAYEQVDVVDAHHEAFDHLRRGEVRFVLLTSGNIARAVLAAFDETTRARVARGEIQIVTISPETGQAVRALGFDVAGEADEFTNEGMLRVLEELVTARPGVQTVAV